MIAPRVLAISLLAATSVGVGVLSYGCSSDSSSPAVADTGPAGTLYDRLGKNAGIKSFIDTLVAEEVKDPDIASFFVFNDGTKAGHPSVGQIKECLVILLGSLTGGPEKYPAAVSGGFMCRDMKTTHAGSHIPSGVFDKFITIGGAVMKKAGLNDADIKTIAGALVGTKPDVVDTTAKEGPFDAGDGADAASGD